MRLQRMMIAIGILAAAASVYGLFAFRLLPAAGEPERTVYVILKSNEMSSSFWQTVRAGAQAAAKEKAANVVIDGPLKESDTGKQVTLLQQAIELRPQAVVIAPAGDNRVLEAIGLVREAGIELVVIDTPLDLGGSSPIFVSNDHREAGRMAGEEAASETGGSPHIGIVSDTAVSPVSAAREQGIREAAAKYRDSYCGTYYAGGSEESAYAAVKRLLAKHAELNVLVTLNEPAALGAAKALKEAGKAGAVRLIGFDSSVYQIQLMEEGTMNALVVEKPFNMGYLGVKTAIRLIDGERTERTAYIEPQIVTKENMYTPENQKLLFPILGN